MHVLIQGLGVHRRCVRLQVSRVQQGMLGVELAQKSRGPVRWLVSTGLMKDATENASDLEQPSSPNPYPSKFVDTTHDALATSREAAV